jgi:hypothetical protein
MIAFPSKPTLILITIITLVQYDNLVADEHDTQQVATDSFTGESINDIVTYPVNYFDRYQPHTALDMVRQVPGFQLDDSTNNIRGFASASGNLLINDRRPSVKQDLPSTILSRIPANLVKHIELIRGQASGIDLRGESLMVNVILQDDATAAIRWEAFLRKREHHGPAVPSISISLSDTWRAFEYNAGLTARKVTFGRLGTDEIFDAKNSLTQNRQDSQENRIDYFNGNFNVSRWLGETFIQLNSNFIYEDRRQELSSERIPTADQSNRRVEVFEDNFDDPRLEIGLDIERNLSHDITGKLIFLFYRKDEDSFKSQTILDDTDQQVSFRLAKGNITINEKIARLEFDWSGLAGHTVQANMEAAVNILDSSLLQTLDSGLGPVIVDVPGSNSRVEEVRWDFLLKDTWSRGKLELDYGLGAEVSTITQTGDAEQGRNFFFLKPQGMLSFSPDQGQQTRFQLARTVSQLNLNDFVSSTIFQDNDLALGNPNVQPDSTWETELSHERRFGQSSVIKLAVFHHWISNVLDLLPLSSTAEAPGNIGDGRRWGLKLESTLPLNWLGLDGARLNIKARWQDSSVIDPVTGKNRVLSSNAGEFIFFDVENKYAYTLDFRQDFEKERVAWGWFVQNIANRPVFKVNELAVYDTTHEINIFIETTRWFGIKMRLGAENILDLHLLRDRRAFVGERNLTPIAFREIRDRTRGRQATFTLSGTF